MIRCCYHQRPDPLCYATEKHAHANPLAGIIGPEKIVHADQAQIAICCRCDTRHPQLPFLFLLRLWMLFRFCKAKPAKTAVDALLEIGKAAEKVGNL